ncbi:MAG: hypothetical protein LBB83_12415 [Treponema sp.]|nr:hypothetical protein [Treponema sp.]
MKPEDFFWIHYTCERLQSGDADYIRSLPAMLCFSADGIDYIVRYQYKPQSYEVIESESLFDRIWHETPYRESFTTGIAGGLRKPYQIIQQFFYHLP